MWGEAILIILSWKLTVILFLFVWREILENPHRLLQFDVCGNFVSADPESDHFGPESVDDGIDVGQGQLKIDPKFASDGSQRTLSLRGPGQKKLHPEGLRLRVF